MNVLIAVHSTVAVWNIPLGHVERLRREFPHHTFIHAKTEQDVLPLVGSAEAAFMGEISREQFAAARRLRWIHSPAAGVGGMLFSALRESPVIVTNSRAMSGDTIAEHVLMLVFALFRKLPADIRNQLNRHWGQDEAFDPPMRTVTGASALVIGLGGIGEGVARRLVDLGASVAGIRRNVRRGGPDGVRVFAPEALGEQLPHADIVVLAAPHTAATRHLIGAKELAAMKTDAVLVNVSRGKLVDEPALVSALAGKTIGGAGLDVFEHEPLDPASPLWTLPNVIVTPHTSGFRADHWDAATDLFAENLRRFDAAEPLLNVVDKEAGY